MNNETLALARKFSDVSVDHTGEEIFTISAFAIQEFAALIRANQREDCIDAYEKGYNEFEKMLKTSAPGTEISDAMAGRLRMVHNFINTKKTIRRKPAHL